MKFRLIGGPQDGYEGETAYGAMSIEIMSPIMSFPEFTSDTSPTIESIDRVTATYIWTDVDYVNECYIYKYKP